MSAAVLCLFRAVYGVRWTPSRVWGLFSGTVSENGAHSRALRRRHWTVRLAVSKDVCRRRERPVMLYRLDQLMQVDVGTWIVSALMNLVACLEARLAHRLSTTEVVLQSHLTRVRWDQEKIRKMKKDSRRHPTSCPAPCHLQKARHHFHYERLRAGMICLFQWDPISALRRPCWQVWGTVQNRCSKTANWSFQGLSKTLGMAKLPGHTRVPPLQ
jgi:hypothetical protein